MHFSAFLLLHVKRLQLKIDLYWAYWQQGRLNS